MLWTGLRALAPDAGSGLGKKFPSSQREEQSRGATLQASIHELVVKPAVGDATPLFIASQNGHGDAVKLLLKHGAKDTCTEDGSSPLPLGLFWNRFAEAAGEFIANLYSVALAEWECAIMTSGTSFHSCTTTA